MDKMKNQHIDFRTEEESDGDGGIMPLPAADS